MSSVPCAASAAWRSTRGPGEGRRTRHRRLRDRRGPVPRFPANRPCSSRCCSTPARRRARSASNTSSASPCAHSSRLMGRTAVNRSALAEGVGFEPTRRFPAHTLSKRAPSATRPPLQALAAQRRRTIAAARLCARRPTRYAPASAPRRTRPRSAASGRPGAETAAGRHTAAPP